MSFARYQGVLKEGLVPGKAYPALSAMGGTAAGGGMTVYLPWEPGMAFFHVTEEGMESWEVSEKAYAVVLRQMDDLRPGEVVVATDWTQDGKVEVEGVGYYGPEYLDILDRTNVTPGVRLLRIESRKWERVVAVDEALWVRTDSDKVLDFRSPEEFEFPVSRDGELMAEPLVTCVRPVARLTMGKKYYLIETWLGDGSWRVLDDQGRKLNVPPSTFRMG